MAVVRQRPTPPYALIVFIVLWAASTAAFVWAFVEYGKAQEQVANKQRDIDAMFRATEQTTVNDLVRTGSAASPNRTAIGQAQYELQTLKAKLAGDQNAKADLNQVITIADSAVKTALGDEKKISLTDAVNTLGEANQTLKKQNAAFAQQLSAAQTAYDNAKKQFDSQIASAQATVDKLQSDLKAMTDQLASVREASNESVKSYEKSKTDLQDQLSKAQRDLVVRLRQAQDELASARAQVTGLKDQVDQLRPNIGNIVALQPDGRIIRADPVRGDMWINLGKKDRVLPGLTFAVYDPRLGVGSGPDGAGKGSIEVVNVGETESFARVTHLTKDQYITTNDVIANPVYSNDRARTYHFVVVGMFDLNQDGQATTAERERVINMIKNYGGVLDDKVTSQTDFVIAGSPPIEGGASSYALMSAEAKALLSERKAAEDRYEAMIQDAKDLSVPVMNANRFLAMLGYYNTAVVSR